MGNEAIPKHGADHGADGPDPIGPHGDQHAGEDPIPIEWARAYFGMGDVRFPDTGVWAYVAGSLETIEFERLARSSDRFEFVTYSAKDNQLAINGSGFYLWETGIHEIDDPDDDIIVEWQANLDAVDATRDTISSKLGFDDAQLNEGGYWGANHYIPDVAGASSLSMNWKAGNDWSGKGWFVIFEDAQYVLSLDMRVIKAGLAANYNVESPFIAVARLGAAMPVFDPT